MITLRILCLLICVFAASTLNAQTVYRSIGPDGKVVYSDRPPSEGQVTKTMKFQNLPSSALPAATLSYVEQLRLKQAAPGAIQGTILYSAAWCGYCKQAKSYLARKGIRYEERDIDTPSGRASYAQAGGRRGVPLLLAKGQRVEGFSSEAYDSVFGSGR